jgi:polyhydroxybutyrate depolymerase
MPATQAAGPRGGRTSDEQRRVAARRPVHSGGIARLIGVALLLAAGPACAAPAPHRVGPPPGDHALTIAVDGRDRSAIVHIPPGYRGDAPVPLVLVLHGGGGDAASAARMTGMSRKSDAEGFVAAYPEGTAGPGGARTWNAGEAYCCGEAMRRRVDDVAFIRALVAHVGSIVRVDERRVYVAGFSNGAMLAHRLGCEAADLVAAIAPVAGALGASDCRSSGPLSVIIFHGTADEHVRYEGGRPLRPGPGEGGRVDPPVADAVAFWARHNRCPPSPQRQERGGVVLATYAGCRGDAEVALYTVEGGGHAWPGGLAGGPRGDAPTRAISATDLMWAFFARHAKRRP